jgi:hypothetical protein
MLAKRREQRIDGEPELIQIDAGRILGAARWIDADGRRGERYQVLTVRDGKIVDLQGCRSRREAMRFARR